MTLTRYAGLLIIAMLIIIQSGCATAPAGSGQYQSARAYWDAQAGGEAGRG